MKKLIALLCALTMVCSLAACANNSANDGDNQNAAEPVVEEFKAEYEVKSVSYTGPTHDTFIFEGKTTDGIITELNFDIIRDKGTDGEYSKKSLMGYMMNVSDAAVEATEDGLALTHLDMYGYSDTLGQYMIYTSAASLTDETTFKDLTVTMYTGAALDLETSIPVYQHLADEAGIELTADTPVSELLAIFGLYADGAFVEGSNRVSFAGANGGRSYGEQLDAIVAHILASNMTLEDVYEMFSTVNQQSTPIADRDTVSGATIAFVGDFQRMAYVAAYGELFEGVVNHTVADGNTTVEVVNQGFGGEIETSVTFDAEGKIVSVVVTSGQETDGIGAALYTEGADFLNALVEGQADLSGVEVVSGATVTSEALIEAVQYAIDYYSGL